MKNLETGLKILSSSIFALYLRTHSVHLNIVPGMNFYAIHKMLDAHWHQLIESYDGLSEQIRALDIYAVASLNEFSMLSMVEDERPTTDSVEMIRGLVISTEKVLGLIKEVNSIAQGHLGLQNFLQGQAQELESQCYFLRSTLGKK
jgi:DNA-binding ferritin-like protein